MSLKRLTVFVVITELIGLGVFFAFLLGGMAALGGTVTLDMTKYGEMWPEYGAMLILTAVVPYALYVLDVWTFGE